MVSDVKSPAKYLVAIEEDEMVSRLLYSFINTQRPAGMTALESLKPFDDEAKQNARRAVRSLMDYWRTCIQNLKATN